MTTTMTRKLTGLPAPLSDAARAYLDAFPPGEVVAFPITQLDRVGLPVWVVALFPEDARLDGVMPYGVGYGADDEAAVLGGLGEIAEMVFPTLALRERNFHRGSWTELTQALGEGAVVDPLTLCLPAGSPVGRGTELLWTEAVRARDAATVLLPLEIAAYNKKEAPEGYTPFTTIISNGMGAGPDVDWALGHGLFELMQRDGNGLLFRALDQGVVLDPPAAPGPETAALIAAFTRAGIDILPKFATDEWGFANLYCVGREVDGTPPVPIMLTACGEACHPDRESALQKALTEFAASRARKAFAHGPAELAEAVAPAGYVRRFMACSGYNGKAGESRAYEAMRDWTTRSAGELASWLAPNVHSRQAAKRFEDLPAAPGHDPRTRGRIARAKLAAAGLETLYVDMAPPGRGIAVAKAVVPGLEVETMSYFRIGARNAAKLLARDHPLVRFGTPSDTLLPVRLTPEAEAAFGGVPLFDTALAAEIVGPLYPLYREPEAHHVAWGERAAA